ncbi:MAG: TraU family protein [Campylobacterales bacterium]|jgi:hypothetical protein|nr:TraU family protein [Campylobacterales bacterium]
MKNKKIAIILLVSALNAHAMELFNIANNLDFQFLMDKTEITLDLCECSIADGGNGVGLTMRLAEPVGVQESTNTPWRLVSLDMDLQEMAQEQGSSREGGGNRRYHHYIAFAPFAFLNLIQDITCFETFPSLGALYLSEVIPSQNSDIVANLVQLSKGPIGKTIYNNMMAMLLALPDCAATTFYEPMNSLLFNVGCAGTTGNNTAYGTMKDDDPLMNHHVLAATQFDDLHFSGMMLKSSNATFVQSPQSAIPNTMCSPQYFPTIIKTEVFIQNMLPTVWSAQNLGMFRTFHADFKNKPGSQDDVASWVWIIKDFCVGGTKCKSIYPGDIF